MNMLAIILAQLAMASSAGEAAKCSGKPAWFHRLDLEQRQLNDFLGALRNKYSIYQGRVAKQIYVRLGVPDDPFATKLNDGNWRLSGFQVHDSSASGAVITDPCGKILAVGVVQYVGRRGDQPVSEAWIYVRHDLRYEELRPDFETWPAARGLTTRVTILPYRP